MGWHILFRCYSSLTKIFLYFLDYRSHGGVQQGLSNHERKSHPGLETQPRYVVAFVSLFVGYPIHLGGSKVFKFFISLGIEFQPQPLCLKKKWCLFSGLAAIYIVNVY
jgi:hypothetical protein